MIIQTDAQLIRDKIKLVKEVYVGEDYPSVNSMTFSNEETVILLFMADNVDHNPCNFNGKDTVHYMVMTMSLIPFSDDTFRIVSRNDLSNDQLKYLISQMRKHFNMEGIQKLGRVKYKPPINVEESQDPYILLDLL